MPVRLALARVRLEVVAIDDERLLRGFACSVYDGDAALFAERRIG